ncbi:MAG: histidine phosphatase family protein [Clostridia bacterium]|jgi:broad specificity phosphatase PhoE
MRLYLTRHGETEWNLERKTQGGTDTPLTTTGIHQAHKLGERLKSEGISFIYSSTLRRAWDTAKIIGEILDCPIRPVEGLREMCLGVWEGLTFNEIQRQYPDIYESWRSTPNLCRIPKADTFDEVRSRSRQFIEFLRNNHTDDERILLVTHALMSKIILADCLRMKPELIHQIRQDNTALNIIDMYDNKVVLSLLNDTCHLRGDEL